MQVTLLRAMGSLLGESIAVDDAVVQQCLHVVGRIVQAYRGLWPKQRIPVHAALNNFLAALAPKHIVLQSTLPQFVSILLSHTLKPAEDNLIAGIATLAEISMLSATVAWCSGFVNLGAKCILPCND